MEKGLSYHEAKQRLATVGLNTIQSHATTTVWKMFLSQFPTLINGILLVAGILSLLLHSVLDSVLILLVIFVNACFGFLQEYRAQKSIEKLRAYTAPTARVIREGKQTEVPAADLVPDDIVVIAEGSRVPADGILIEGKHIEIDESLLTGESFAVIKKTNELVYAGTMVAKGKGVFRITATGMKTKFGQLAHTLETIQSDKAPLQKNLSTLGKYISLFVLAIGGLIILIGLLMGREFFPLMLTAASIGVAAIPEGLPAVVTIAFAVGAHRMAKRNAVVRKMAAIETLGSVQIILTDKTGTITQNHMRVKRYWLPKKETLSELIHACTLGNTASLVEKGSGHDFEVIGDQTDGALLLWAQEQKQSQTNEKSGKVIDEYVFDSETKTITTVWEQNKEKYVYVRGAPETILERCILSSAEKKKINEIFNEYANAGLRTIGFGMKREKHSQPSRDHLEQELTFLGFIAIYDPPREEVAEAIKKSRSAGIQVIMVTGDSEQTALTLSKEIGLIEKDEDVITGEELEKLSDEELGGIITNTRIFARTKPEQKLRLVTLLKDKGFVVGVTGDGVNDALALKRADVGVAMGKGGTDVAKEASDIILTDDNFATLMRAVEEGRTIYKNISNAVLYLFSGNLAQLLLILFATLFQLPFPLLPTQILWINLVTDTLPALALATGEKDPSALSKKPRNAKAGILTLDGILTISFIGVALCAFLLFIFNLLLSNNSEAEARTVVFNLLIFSRLIIATILGRHAIKRGNLLLIVTVIIILVLQIIITITPVFQNIFHLAN